MHDGHDDKEPRLGPATTAELEAVLCGIDTGRRVGREAPEDELRHLLSALVQPFTSATERDRAVWIEADECPAIAKVLTEAEGAPQCVRHLALELSHPFCAAFAAGAVEEAARRGGLGL